MEEELGGAHRRWSIYSSNCPTLTRTNRVTRTVSNWLKCEETVQDPVALQESDKMFVKMLIEKLVMRIFRKAKTVPLDIELFQHSI